MAPAYAQPTPAPSSTTASYDHLIEEALQAYEAGRFAEARTSFRRAHELAPTARTLRTIGMCSFNLGDYAEAVWSLESALTDKRKPLTEEQRAHVTDLITRANQHIGRFRMRLMPADVTLIVDGRPALVLGHSELLLEAGHHEIEARAPAYHTAYSTLNVDGGDRTTLIFGLTPDELSATPASTVNSRAPGADQDIGRPRVLTTSDTSSSGSALRTVGFVTLGVGVAGLIGFGVSGGLALSEENRLAERCPNTSCTIAYQKDVDRYDTLRTVSTATLIGGGAFALLGITLLLLPSHPSSERAANIQPMIGIGSVGVRGQL
ncbi:MAG: tetratricopeptide repeat protein [Polyangiales bacterium]